MNNRDKLQRLLTDYKRMEKENAYLKRLNVQLMRQIRETRLPKKQLIKAKQNIHILNRYKLNSSQAAHVPKIKYLCSEVFFEAGMMSMLFAGNQKKGVPVTVWQASMNGSAPFAAKRK